MSYNYNVSIEEIAAGLAHEVKNPLSLVKANIDLLELEDTRKSNEKAFKIMRREIERINDLLLSFIQFSRISESNNQEFSLNEVLYDLVDELRSIYRIEFNLTIDKNDYFFCGDKEKIRRVVLNILKNAVESIEEGKHGIIDIKLAENCRQIVLEIKDNGKGISDNDAKNLFKPFYTTKQGGSGLGLYLCRSIIEEYGGEMYITGSLGNGCTAIIRLPV